MSFVALMVHPRKGQMHVPEKKLQEYLDLGYVEVERIQLEVSAKPAEKQAIENIEAKVEKPPAKSPVKKK